MINRLLCVGGTPKGMLLRRTACSECISRRSVLRIQGLQEQTVVWRRGKEDSRVLRLRHAKKGMAHVSSRKRVQEFTGLYETPVLRYGRGHKSKVQTAPDILRMGWSTPKQEEVRMSHEPNVQWDSGNREARILRWKCQGTDGQPHHQQQAHSSGLPEATVIWHRGNEEAGVLR